MPDALPEVEEEGVTAVSKGGHASGFAPGFRGPAIRGASVGHVRNREGGRSAGTPGARETAGNRPGAVRERSARFDIFGVPR